MANSDTPTSFRLYKKEKLCSTVAIDQLFGRGGVSVATRAALIYPLRAVWHNNPRRRSDAPVQFLISVPKRRLRHAVDRVQMRRRIREAYRLNRHQCLLPSDARFDVAFIYVASELMPYAAVELAMHKLLDRISRSASTLLPDEETDKSAANAD